MESTASAVVQHIKKILKRDIMKIATKIRSHLTPKARKTENANKKRKGVF
jgi:hypothetical protein